MYNFVFVIFVSLTFGSNVCDTGTDPVLTVHIGESGSGFGYANANSVPVWGVRIPKVDELHEDNKFWTGELNIRVAVGDTDKMIKFTLSSSQRMFETVAITKSKRKPTQENDDKTGESNLPGFVLVDPDLSWLLAKVHICQHPNMWISMLLESNSVVAEWHALSALKHLPTPKVVKVLIKYLQNENRYHGLRARALRALIHMHNNGLQTSSALQEVVTWLESRLLFEKDEVKLTTGMDLNNKIFTKGVDERILGFRVEISTILKRFLRFKANF